MTPLLQFTAYTLLVLNSILLLRTLRSRDYWRTQCLEARQVARQLRRHRDSKGRYVKKVKP